MLKMINGAKVFCADKLNEGYVLEDNFIKANVNCDKIEKLIKEFIELEEGPYFLILEIPSKQDREKDIVGVRDDITILNSLHKDVYYLDGMSSEMALQIFDTFSELFINDGMLQFGFGNHSNNSEIMKHKYNVISIYMADNDSKKYISLLEKNNIRLDENFKTAWDYFDKDNPGEALKIETDDGKDIYDAVEVLKDIGLYLGEIRKEK